MRNTGRDIGRPGNRGASFGTDAAAGAGAGPAEDVTGGPGWQISVVNRQRQRAVDTRRLAGWVRLVLTRFPDLRGAELSICLLGDREMTGLNESFVGHEGPTDVITFDYSEPGSGSGVLAGEICIGVEEAARQARRYRTDWSREVARYVIHGILHLRGYDDADREARRQMKRVEDRLLRWLARKAGGLWLGRGKGGPVRAPLVKGGPGT